MRFILPVLTLLACGKDPPPFPGQGGGSANDLDTDPPDPTVPDTGSEDDTGSASDADADTDTDADVDADDTGSTDADADADGGGEDTGVIIEGPFGYTVGLTAHNLSALDAASNPWALHVHYGRPIVLLVGNLDKLRTTDTLEAMAEVKGEHGEMLFAAFIGEDAVGTGCEAACAGEVAAEYGLTALYDANPARTTHTTWIQSRDDLYLYVIDSTMVIRWANPGSASAAQLGSELEDIGR